MANVNPLLAAFIVFAVAPTFAQQPRTAPATLTLRGEVLDALASRAQRITLGEGQSQDLTLRLIRH